MEKSNDISYTIGLSNKIVFIEDQMFTKEDLENLTVKELRSMFDGKFLEFAGEHFNTILETLE